jgi:hypothetical protein
MGLAEDLKALQDLREKGELSEAAYKSARDATLQKHGAAPSGSFQVGRFVGKFIVLPVLVVLILVVVLHLMKWPESRTNPQANLPPTAPYAPPQPTKRYVTITNGALTVGAGQLLWVPFTLPVGVSAVQVQGHFTATGGMGNDIIVYVADADAFINLRNGHQVNVYYNSQKVTQESINAVLPNTPGTYYLILDNRFSLITPKAVAVNATLTYMQ